MDIICYSTAGNEYALYEQRSGNVFQLRCIDGRRTSCGNCIGYCKYAGHEGFLTKELRKKHNCLGKQCDYYLPKPKKEKNVIAITSFRRVK